MHSKNDRGGVLGREHMPTTKLLTKKFQTKNYFSKIKNAKNRKAEQIKRNKKFPLKIKSLLAERRGNLL